MADEPSARPPPDMAQLKRAKPLDGLETRIGVEFLDRARAERALTHASVKREGARNYERLEFLGDRVLGLAVAEKLLSLYPNSDEGELSVRLNAIVSAETCAEIADEIGLTPYVRHGGDVRKTDGRHSRNIRADVVEALIAAIYLDHGLETARDFVLRHWAGRLADVSLARRDPKTELQEWSHKRSGKVPSYELVERQGPDHDPVFTVRATVDGVRPAEGRGKSKRAAEQVAAETLLRREGVWSADG